MNQVYQHHLRKARLFIEANVRTQITVEQCAATVGLNRVYFIKVFRQAFGETPMSMHRRLRAEIAMRLLKRFEPSTVVRCTGYRSQHELHNCLGRVMADAIRSERVLAGTAELKG